MKSRIVNEKANIEKMLSEGKSYAFIAKFYGYKKSYNFKRAFKTLKEEGQRTYECRYCGKTFNNPQKLAGHVTFCPQNPNIEKHLAELSKSRVKAIKKREDEVHVCPYCGKETHNNGAYALHVKHCKANPNYVKKEVTSKGKSHVAWNKGKTVLNDELVARMAQKRRHSIEEGKYIPHKTKHTIATKEKMRKSMIQYIKNTNISGFQQHYSVKGCNYIDKINEERGWHLQHANNGGEVEVLGYFLDGYDKELNIAFEYDEPYHYEDVYNNKLKQKDIERQNYIIKKLNCEFYRYNEKIDLFYKIE